VKALTVQETADMLGCSKTFLYDEIKRESIPAMRFGTRVLIDEDDIPEIVAHYKHPARVSA